MILDLNDKFKSVCIDVCVSQRSSTTFSLAFAAFTELGTFVLTYFAIIDLTFGFYLTTFGLSGFSSALIGEICCFGICSMTDCEWTSFCLELELAISAPGPADSLATYDCTKDLAFVVWRPSLSILVSVSSGVAGLTTEVSPLFTGGGMLMLKILRANIFKFFFSKSSIDYGGSTKLFANFLIWKVLDEALLARFTIFAAIDES